MKMCQIDSEQQQQKKSNKTTFILGFIGVISLEAPLTLELKQYSISGRTDTHRRDIWM